MELVPIAFLSHSSVIVKVAFFIDFVPHLEAIIKHGFLPPAVWFRLNILNKRPVFNDIRLNLLQAFDHVCQRQVLTLEAALAYDMQQVQQGKAAVLALHGLEDLEDVYLAVPEEGVQPLLKVEEGLHHFLLLLLFHLVVLIREVRPVFLEVLYQTGRLLSLALLFFVLVGVVVKGVHLDDAFQLSEYVELDLVQGLDDLLALLHLGYKQAHLRNPLEQLRTLLASLLAAHALHLADELLQDSEHFLAGESDVYGFVQQLSQLNEVSDFGIGDAVEHHFCDVLYVQLLL